MTMSPESGYTTPGQRMATTAQTGGYVPKPSMIGPVSPPTYAPVPSPVVSAGEELKWLDGELGTLHEQLRTLAARLEPVLTPPGPDADGSGKAQSLASPLVDKLRDDRSVLENANRILGRLIDRIEL